MSCTFWMLRKRRAAMQRKQELEAQKAVVPAKEEKAEPAEKKPVKKAVKKDDNPTD